MPSTDLGSSICANGDVTPCDFAPLAFGNVGQRPLEDIWQAMTTGSLHGNMSASCRPAQPECRTRLARLSHSTA